jgi:hypothetical protein
MEKIKPLGAARSSELAKLGQTEENVEMIAANHPENEMKQPDELEQLMQVGGNGMADTEMAADEDKENAVLNANSQDLLDMVSNKGIVVREKGGTGQPIELVTGQEAYFALLAQDMLAIATHFSVGVQEVHKIFYEVNCNRENLLKVLADKEGHQVKRWQTLEDLALRHSEDTLSFQVVLNDKGREEVNLRKAFLELC